MGRSQLFSEAMAADLPPYVDPGGAFTQLCQLAIRPDSRFTVFFRPDRNQSRFEVVVELGWPGDAPLSSPSYMATINVAGELMPASPSSNIIVGRAGDGDLAAPYTFWR